MLPGKHAHQMLEGGCEQRMLWPDRSADDVDSLAKGIFGFEEAALVLQDQSQGIMAFGNANVVVSKNFFARRQSAPSQILGLLEQLVGVRICNRVIPSAEHEREIFQGTGHFQVFATEALFTGGKSLAMEIF